MRIALLVALFALLTSCAPSSVPTPTVGPDANPPTVATATVAATRTTPTSTGSLLLYQQLDEAGGGVQPELIVADGQGKELRRVALPDVEQGVGTLRPGTALYRTLDGAFYLVDALAGTARQLELPPSEEATLELRVPQISGGGRSWWLLGDTTMRRLVLLNLATGETLDLAALPPLAAAGDESSLFFAGAFSPDEAYLALLSDQGLWLIPTASPARARRLGGEAAVGADFSSDSSLVVYVDAGAGGRQAFVQPVGEGEPVAVGADVRQARFVPGHAALVLRGETTLSLYALSEQAERPLPAGSRAPGLLAVAPGGGQLLTSEGDEPVWRLVDLAAGSARTLDGLRGLQLMSFGLGRRWLLLGGGPGQPAERVMRVDLETGQVGVALETPPETTFVRLAAETPDGAAALVHLVSPGDEQLLLARAEGGQPVRLGSGSGGVFSPDGTQLVVGLREPGAPTTLQLLDVTSLRATPLGPGAQAVWVPGD